jgi:DNA-binding response OmpR family regulator
MPKKILILDDDKDILEVLSIILSESGYEIEALSSGETIFEAIKEFHPDLVLMDIMLQGMDGRIICKNIKNHPPTQKLPVILISASHNVSKLLLEQGAPNDFIAKPFELSSLLEKIKGHLAG